MNKVLLFILTVITLNGISQTSDLKLASDIWPPFTNIETKKSFATDLVKEALRRADIQSDIDIISFDNLLQGIKEANYDGSAALWKSVEREKDFLYSEPYLQNQLILVGQKGSDVHATSFNDLQGKKIGVVNNYAYGIDENDSQKIEFINGESDQQNLERLLSNQIDYMLVDALLMQYLLKFQVNDVTEFLEVGPSPLVLKSLHFVLGKHVKNGQEIISAFNDEITKMIADGTYNEILELNWIQADIDGDGKMEIILDSDKAGKEAPRNIYGVYQSSSSGKKDSVNRYYIDGTVYTGWDNIPQQYKNEMVMSSQSIENTGIKLDFK